MRFAGYRSTVFVLIAVPGVDMSIYIYVYIYIYTSIYICMRVYILANACAVLARRGCAVGLGGGLCGILKVVRGLGRGALNPVQLEAPTS